MQRFRVITPRIFHESLSLYITSVYNEKTPSNKCGILCNTTKERCLSILLFVKENTAANTIDELYAMSMMRSVDVIPSNKHWQRLSCNLIGCIFYAMVEKFVFLHVSVSISNDTLGLV